MASGESKYALPIAEERRILLLDANSTSREARAKALRDRGVNVDCVAGSQDARMVWRPGAYEIVLIDFRTTGEDGRDFHRYAAFSARKQKFGFYMSGAPYLTSSRRQCESAAATVILEPAEAPPDAAKLEWKDGECQTGLCEAARRIATLRRLTHPGAAPEGAKSRGLPAAEAMRIASQVLDGGS
jgi:CheY-like chemotaxis protein